MARKLDLHALAAGASSGLRTFTAPAATARAGQSAWTGLLATLAAGELLADKLPVAPSRLRPAALAARALAGGLCGRTVAERRGSCTTLGAGLGALAALGAAWSGYTLRRYLTTERGWPDPLVAVGEDAIAFGLVWCANAA